MALKKLPNRKVLLSNEDTVNLRQLQGNPLVLFFYPRANTPGCTQEARDFNQLYLKFRRQSAMVLGASRDSLKAQQNFRNKYEMRFELISDPEEKLCNAFGVIKEKNMYGKKVMGIERSTFLFDKDGNLAAEWRGVKVKGHAQEVLDALKAL